MSPPARAQRLTAANRNISVRSNSMDSSSDTYLRKDKPEILHSCFHGKMYKDSLTSYSNSSIISQLLRKTIQNKKALKESFLYLPATALPSSYTADSSQVNWSCSSFKEGMYLTKQHSMAAGSEEDPPHNEHHQAKRARVENIIRGMGGSPKARPHHEWEISGTSVKGSREEKWMQMSHTLEGGCMPRRTSSIKDEERHSLRQQLQNMQRLLKHLQERFLQIDNLSETQQEDGMEEVLPNIMYCHNTLLKKEFLEWPDCALRVDPDSEFERKTRHVRMSQKQTVQKSNIQIMHNKEDQELLEVLKHELSRAVSRSVDLVFKNFSSAISNRHPRLLAGLDCNSELSGSPEPSLGADVITAQSAEFTKGADMQNPEDQTEALPLVIRNPHSVRPCPMNQVLKQPHDMTQLPLQFKQNVPFQNEILENLLKYGPHDDLRVPLQRILPTDTSSPQILDLPWSSSKACSKLSSSHIDTEATETQPASLGQERMEAACFSQVKLEHGNLQGVVERNPYLSLNIQEGLTPNHLKKAKLMFFYTRYPSSSVLKSFFPDVKFNRCITSQLIKWFSNFREFYYIQMEKFARQAILDGSGSTRDLSVTRDSELFRALNTHYNKANDFQVPERFLEVAEVTLKEFFNAILQAKDKDPSWKKAIYKVICKLDGDVPDYFKSFACS
nr:prospero homeobox protein 1-like isoform X2 [Paramormyrops kingsleyae]XP_023668612.1 prospero homeobox protein 1-like isoform X2 [Paramormyrops kingsleyae]XP_023668613.1 prospero homeobox protein 1-like isoform X2 [Paramormyrops kingsleyae]XP_023668614.1 prospero homeobox protein 1-like isoform X2 [Paramormyrops kingsleyae]